MLAFLLYLWFWKSIHISYCLLRFIYATLQINLQLIDKKGRFHHFLKSTKWRKYAEIEKDEKIKDEGLKKLVDEKLKLQDQILSLISEIDDLKHI